MTIESAGHEYTFEGFLTSSEFKADYEPDRELSEATGWVTYTSSGFRQRRVELEINVLGEITRTVMKNSVR